MDLDIGFIVDSSGSLKTEYHKEKEFIQSVVDLLSGAGRRVRASLVSFSDTARLVTKFSEYTGKDNFKKIVANLPLEGQSTRIDTALNVAYTQMFGAGSGARQNARKVLVLLTDGEQSATSGSVSPSVAVMPFHKDKIKVLVIGIGPAVNARELMSVVAKPDYFYAAQNFNELKSSAFVSQIIDASCEISGKLQIIRRMNS